MDNDTTPQDDAAMSPASTGSVAEDRLLFRLAIHLETPVDKLKRRMDSQEMTHWMAYMRYFPSGKD